VRTYLSAWVAARCVRWGLGVAHSAHFRRIAGILVQQGQIGVEEESFQIMVAIPYVLLSDHGWLQVVALFNSRVCGQPIHRASATVRTPPPQCAQSNRVFF
jgi:hypothetical protein